MWVSSLFPSPQQFLPSSHHCIPPVLQYHLCLCSFHPRLQCVPSAIRHRKTHLVGRLHLGQTSHHLHHRLSGHLLLSNPPLLQIPLAPSSLGRPLHPRLPQLNLWPPNPHFNLGRSSLWLRLNHKDLRHSLLQLCSSVAEWASSTSSLPLVIPTLVPISTPQWQSHWGAHPWLWPE